MRTAASWWEAMEARQRDRQSAQAAVKVGFLLFICPHAYPAGTLFDQSAAGSWRRWGCSTASGRTARCGTLARASGPHSWQGRQRRGCSTGQTAARRVTQRPELLRVADTPSAWLFSSADIPLQGEVASGPGMQAEPQQWRRWSGSLSQDSAVRRSRPTFSWVAFPFNRGI